MSRITNLTRTQDDLVSTKDNRGESSPILAAPRDHHECKVVKPHIHIQIIKQQQWMSESVKRLSPFSKLKYQAKHWPQKDHNSHYSTSENSKLQCEPASNNCNVPQPQGRLGHNIFYQQQSKANQQSVNTSSNQAFSQFRQESHLHNCTRKHCVEHYTRGSRIHHPQVQVQQYTQTMISPAKSIKQQD